MNQPFWIETIRKISEAPLQGSGSIDYKYFLLLKCNLQSSITKDAFNYLKYLCLVLSLKNHGQNLLQ